MERTRRSIGRAPEFIYASISSRATRHHRRRFRPKLQPEQPCRRPRMSGSPLRIPIGFAPCDNLRTRAKGPVDGRRGVLSKTMVISRE